MQDYAEKQLQPKTLFRYKEMLTTRIIPVLGHIKMDKLQPTHLLEFYSNLQEKGIRIDVKYIVKPDLMEILKEKGMSIKVLAEKSNIGHRTIKGLLAGKSIAHTTAQAITKALDIKVDNIFSINGEAGCLSDQTIKHHHRLISSILTTAVQWQCLLNNPAERVKPPKVEKKEAAHYDEDMAEYMLSLLIKEPIKYRAMVYVAIYAGVRLGELCGIEWTDIDFDNNFITIHQASQYLPNMGTFTKDPKNESSKRTISMPPVLMKLLKKYKTWQNEECLGHAEGVWQESGRVFTQWNGLPIHPSTPTKWFLSFRRKHNLPDLKFHGLRHTNASLLIGQGVDVQTVAKRLGHTKATTTTTIYSHFLRKPDKEAADKLENIFKKKTKKVKKA